jgi:hypothetical protein
MDVDKPTFKACLIARLAGGQVLVKASKTFPNKETGFTDLLAWSAKHRKEADIPQRLWPDDFCRAGSRNRRF